MMPVANEPVTAPSSMSADDEALSELTAQLSQFNWKEGVVDKAKRLLFSQDIQDNIKGVLSLKAMLCIGREEVYAVAQEVIDSGVITRLVEFLAIDNADLQWPSAFCLTNIAAGHDTQTQTVVEAGAVPSLVSFLRHPDNQLRRQAIFCLANVAGSTKEYRIMLARDPNYFPAIISAGELAGDAKVLELVCWNLRNICLLGGPSFEEIKPGVEFLLNKILKRYWHFQYWAGCVRFAIETISSICKTPEGLIVMINEDLTSCILSFLECLDNSTVSVSQSAFDALTWIVAFGGEAEKHKLLRSPSVINIIVNSGIQGRYGAIVQELCLKCLVCLASGPSPDQLYYVLASHEQLLDISARIFLESLAPGSITATPNSNTAAQHLSLAASATTIKKCAAFIFTSCVLLTPNFPSLLIKVVLSPGVIKVLLEVIEFGAEQSRGGDETLAPVGCGPGLLEVLDTLTVSGLKALLSHLSQGESVQQEERLPENPILQVCLEHDISNRLRQVLNNTALPPEGYELGSLLLSQILHGASQKSKIFS